MSEEYKTKTGEKMEANIKSTGYYSTGRRSTGNYSTGDRSTGDRSTGNYSTGDRSTGDRSTGYCSTGNCSTGYYSTGNCSVGHFCTEDYAPHGWFNVPSKVRWSEISEPHFMEFYLTKWISEDEMTGQEKIDNKTFQTTKGYLKTYTYKEAWANFWRDTDDDNRKKFLDLPHFDAEIFKEITGIDVSAKNCEGEMVEVDGVKYKLVRA